LFGLYCANLPITKRRLLPCDSGAPVGYELRQSLKEPSLFWGFRCPDVGQLLYFLHVFNGRAAQCCHPFLPCCASVPASLKPSSPLFCRQRWDVIIEKPTPDTGHVVMMSRKCEGCNTPYACKTTLVTFNSYGPCRLGVLPIIDGLQIAKNLFDPV